MSRRAFRFELSALLTLAGAWAGAPASAQSTGNGGVPPADGAAPAAAPPLARPPDDPARAQRLSALRAKNDAEIAAQASYGHLDEFLAAAKSRPGNYGKVKWMKVGDGFVSTLSLQRYELWNTPEPGRTAIRALDFELEDHPLAAIIDLDRELRAHGVDFVLVKLPTRAQLYPELMVPALPAEGMRPFSLASRKFDARLLDEGVEVIDLGPLFFEQRLGADGGRDDLLFLRTDPHWTPRACELAARTVADALLARGVAPGPAQEGKDFVVDRLKVEYSATSVYKPEGAGVEPLPVTRVRTARGKKLDPEDDASPIVVMGDSFVRVHDMFETGFQRQLYRFMGQKIDAIAPEAGGESGARDMLQRRRADLAKKKVVVWLASEQIFRVGENWEPSRIFE